MVQAHTKIRSRVYSFSIMLNTDSETEDGLNFEAPCLVCQEHAIRMQVCY
jgi:hypothetical protein